MGWVNPHESCIQLRREVCVDEPASEHLAEIQSTTSVVLVVCPTATERGVLAGHIVPIAMQEGLWATRDNQKLETCAGVFLVFELR